MGRYWKNLIRIGCNYTGFICLSIGNSGRCFLTQLWTFGFHKRQGISWLAEQLLAYQEGLCSMWLMYIVSVFQLGSWEWCSVLRTVVAVAAAAAAAAKVLFGILTLEMEEYCLEIFFWTLLCSQSLQSYEIHISLKLFFLPQYLIFCGHCQASGVGSSSHLGTGLK